MATVDRNLIVGLTESELMEYVCSICNDILRDPIVMKCCRQTYCRKCIDHWLQTSNTCPNDRSVVDSTSVLEAPRMVTNVLDNLKTKCERHNLGCTEVIHICDIAQHSLVCQFARCDVCGHTPRDAHNCIDELKSALIQKDDEIARLLKEVDDFKSSQGSAKSSSDRCLLSFKHPALPFYQRGMLRDVNDSYKMTVMGTISSDPHEFAINIMSAGNPLIHMNHRWFQDNTTVFNSADTERWGQEEYRTFKSLMPKTNFIIVIVYQNNRFEVFVNNESKYVFKERLVGTGLSRDIIIDKINHDITISYFDLILI